jgi:hypothetical protein
VREGTVTATGTRREATSAEGSRRKRSGRAVAVTPPTSPEAATRPRAPGLRYRQGVGVSARPGLYVGICLLVLAGVCALAGQAQTSAAAAAGGQGGPAPGGPYDLRALELSISRHPEIHRRVEVRARGLADPPLRLWAYVDPRGEPCPASPSAQAPRARTIFSAAAAEGDFLLKERLRVKTLGLHSFCGYLGANDGSEVSEDETTFTTSFVTRKVRRRLLQAPRARRTVARALLGHGFAERVVDTLERRCRRLNRAKFSCRFSSRFPGYRLVGGGHVELNGHLSYRLRVRVGQRHFTLTEDN